MTRAHYAFPANPKGPSFDTPDIVRDEGPSVDKHTEREAKQVMATLQRARLIETEKRATSCAPTMRTIRLADNSAYDSNCPAVWRHAVEMGLVVR